MEASYKKLCNVSLLSTSQFLLSWNQFTITPTIAILISCNLNSFGASSRNDGHDLDWFDMDYQRWCIMMLLQTVFSKIWLFGGIQAKIQGVPIPCEPAIWLSYHTGDGSHRCKRPGWCKMWTSFGDFSSAECTLPETNVFPQKWMVERLVSF